MIYRTHLNASLKLHVVLYCGVRTHKECLAFCVNCPLDVVGRSTQIQFQPVFEQYRPPPWDTRFVRNLYSLCYLFIHFDVRSIVPPQVVLLCKV